MLSGQALMGETNVIVALAVLAAINLVWAAMRTPRCHLRRVQLEIEFADSLQLARDETGAQRLLCAHIERSVSGSTAAIFARDDGRHQWGRPHCGDCAQRPGHSFCSPLVVDGQVLGSVVVNRSSPCNAVQRQQVGRSVTRVGLVLGTMRSLANAELRAATDALTGLPNKQAVDDALVRMYAHAARTLSPLSLLLLDLDHFKNINDRFGHPIGDQTLAEVGLALRSVLRDSDFAGRNGGEEFAVILPDTDATGATATAEKIRTAIAGIRLPGLDLTVTVSVGVCTYPNHATDLERLTTLADAALYVAKRSGRNRIATAKRQVNYEIGAPGRMTELRSAGHIAPAVT